MALLHEPTLLLNLFYAMLFGVFIGFERQLRSRLQILRTTTLISVGAALFTNLGANAFENSDPTRVAAQIVSGIGFLGAGIIIQHGSSVTGLNTAATLWASAAVGALAGAGRADIALAGMILIFLVNIVLRPITQRLSKMPHLQESTETEYAVSIRCDADAEANIRQVLFDGASTDPLQIRSLTCTKAAPEDGRNFVTIDASIFVSNRCDEDVERALRPIIDDPRVRDIRWIAKVL